MLCCSVLQCSSCMTNSCHHSNRLWRLAGKVWDEWRTRHLSRRWRSRRKHNQPPSYLPQLPKGPSISNIGTETNARSLAVNGFRTTFPMSRGPHRSCLSLTTTEYSSTAKPQAQQNGGLLTRHWTESCAFPTWISWIYAGYAFGLKKRSAFVL